MSTIRKNKNVSYISGDDSFLSPVYDATEDILKRASWLGIVAGLRSMTPMAVLVWTQKDVDPRLKTLMVTLAAGEMIADKLPFIPNRLKPGPFIGRVVFGAAVGALLCQREQLSTPLAGALRGAAGAVLGTCAGAAYRSVISNVTGIPDAVCAVAEDGVAIALGFRAATPGTPKMI